MWKVIIFVYLMGQPVQWATPADYYTKESCAKAGVEIVDSLIYTVISNNLDQQNDFVAQAWCVQPTPKQSKI